MTSQDEVGRTMARPGGARRCARVAPQRRARWLWPLAGLLALVWFCVRVIPKPSRATYPCQRAAFPMAAGFVAWLLGGLASVAVVHKARRCLARSRYAVAAALAVMAVGTMWTVTGLALDAPALAETEQANQPIGVAQGVHPGRVVWVHDPAATDWAGPRTGQRWYDHTDTAVVGRMMADAVRGLAGEDDLKAAWDAIFRDFNERVGRGGAGYRAGERIFIKVNHTLCADADWLTRAKPRRYVDNIDNSPRLTAALLRQLVGVVGVAPQDITVGDPSRLMPNYWYDRLRAEPGLEEVVLLSRGGGGGRVQADYSDVAFHWSDPDQGRMARATIADRVPACYAEADYVINFPVLKSHDMAGITVCAKNLYGSLIRNPNAREGRRGREGRAWYNMHETLARSEPQTGRYRCLVDLMGHPGLGGKTVLYLVDGLYAGQDWDGVPVRWRMAPFNGGWPNSIFVSQDAVAVDSVCLDFLRAEWQRLPHMPGTADYLHEAALASDPPSGAVYDPDGDGAPMASLGVHEHWDNAADKQYSRNLGAGEGIELVYVGPPAE